MTYNRIDIIFPKSLLYQKKHMSQKCHEMFGDLKYALTFAFVDEK